MRRGCRDLVCGEHAGFRPIVRNAARFRASVGIALLAVLTWVGTSCAQESPLPQQSVLSQQQTTNPTATPCVKPPPMVTLEEYNGPLHKTVGLFARDLNRKAVHPPHYKPGLALCSLEVKDKFLLFISDSFDPVTFMAAGFNAGLSQATNQDPTFGQGAAGYGKRFGASFADQVSLKFFMDFAYPSIFHEDPRYYRLIHGSSGRRLLHAIDHAFVAQRDNGNRMFNVSEWLGTASVSALSNMYHPGNERGFAPAAQLVGYSIAEDIGFDVLREFWPEIARKFRLPFRVEPAPDDVAANPAIK
jgi:hypothetical protein